MQGVVKQRVNWNFIRQEITKKKLDPVGSTVRYEVMKLIIDLCLMPIYIEQSGHLDKYNPRTENFEK